MFWCPLPGRCSCPGVGSNWSIGRRRLKKIKNELILFASNCASVQWVWCSSVIFRTDLQNVTCTKGSWETSQAAVGRKGPYSYEVKIQLSIVCSGKWLFIQVLNIRKSKVPFIKLSWKVSLLQTHLMSPHKLPNRFTPSNNFIGFLLFSKFQLTPVSLTLMTCMCNIRYHLWTTGCGNNNIA